MSIKQNLSSLESAFKEAESRLKAVEFKADERLPKVEGQDALKASQLLQDVRKIREEFAEINKDVEALKTAQKDAIKDVLEQLEKVGRNVEKLDNAGISEQN